MAVAKGRNRAKEFEDLLGAKTQDFDPERDEYRDDEGSEDESEREDYGAQARQHYAPVSKSKIRKADPVPLGPQYRGSKIGRHEVNDDDDGEDDPLSRGFDDESGSEEDIDMDGSEEDENEDEEDDSQTDMTDEDDEQVHSTSKPSAPISIAEKNALKAELANSTTSTSSIVQANRQDAAKGRAVLQQRKAFDSLISVRMKLQKSLIAANTLTSIPPTQSPTDLSHSTDSLARAETAALNLFNTLSALRSDLATHRSGTKRSAHNAFTPITPTTTLFSHLRDQDTQFCPMRDAILQKWSRKLRNPTESTSRSGLTSSANGNAQSTVLDVVQEQLSNPARLLKRARTPRSCAPVQAARGLGGNKEEGDGEGDRSVYDDADFYGVLLQELLAQKSVEGGGGVGGVSGRGAIGGVDVSWQMRRENKTRKVVDTKASKGRKLRYTVHEKLQNFMAPEDRGKWGERQAVELFGSLFGRNLGLGEREDEVVVGGEEVTMDDGVDAEEAALMMFRS